MLRSVKYGLYGAVLAGLVGGSVLWQQVDKSVTLYVDGTPTHVRTTAADVADVLAEEGYRAGAHDLLAPAAAESVSDGSTIVYKRGRLLRLSIDGSERDVWTTAPTVATAMEQLGFSTATFTSVSRSQRLPLGATDIAIRTPKRISVTHDGTVTQVTTTDATVGQVVDALGLDLATDDRISQQLTDPLINDMQIVVNRVVKTTTYTTKTIEFGTVHKTDADLPAGTVKITQKGAEGLERTAYAVVYVDGKMVGKTKLATDLVRRPVDKIESVGTGSQPEVYASSGSSTVSVTPGSAQAIAKALLAERGWGDDQFGCLIEMWNHESGWRVNAANPSGAYGIPQALPGSKMASAGADWQTNPATQIKWGLGYIADRYSTPCGAWAQWQANGGWY